MFLCKLQIPARFIKTSHICISALTFSEMPVDGVHQQIVSIHRCSNLTRARKFCRFHFCVKVRPKSVTTSCYPQVFMVHLQSSQQHIWLRWTRVPLLARLAPSLLASRVKVDLEKTIRSNMSYERGWGELYNRLFIFPIPRPMMAQSHHNIKHEVLVSPLSFGVYSECVCCVTVEILTAVTALMITNCWIIRQAVTPLRSQ